MALLVLENSLLHFPLWNMNFKLQNKLAFIRD